MKTAKAPSIESAMKTLHGALTVLKENGGEMRGRDVIHALGERLKLSDWERATYEKTGYVRWQSILHFYSIDAAKAGFLIKKRGVWYLTPEGAQAVSLSPEQLFDQVREAYKIWRIANPKLATSGDELEEAEEVE